MFGVDYWDTKEQAESKKDLLREWQKRGEKFIKPRYFFISPGSFSPEEYNPTTLPIHQIKMFRPKQYSNQYNYWRLGFRAGLTRALQDFHDCDAIIHYQGTKLISERVAEKIHEFLEMSTKSVMAMQWSSGAFKEPIIDVGFMVMKPHAARYMLTTGYRQTLDIDEECITVDEEIHKQVSDCWYNPWQNIPTSRQIDCPAYTALQYGLKCAPRDITNINKFVKLPIISTGKHATEEFVQEWIKHNSL